MAMAEVLTNAAEYTVSEISQALKRTVEEAFDHVRVRGEITGFRGTHASGHAYFALKDANARIEAVVWRSTWIRLGFKPEEGMEVIATGRLTTFPGSSKYQIVIDRLEPAGVGALMALIEERRKKFLAEGLFDAGRKKALPYLPRVIGVITSPTGAVIRDILHRLSDRFPTHVIVWPCRVQGDTCAPEVAAAITGFNALPKGGIIARPDLLIVARGGGSIEDLWGFNDEAVVRAVAASRIPVISAVGHETDFTLIDYVADLRAPTPTAAAEAAVPVRADLIAYVAELNARQRRGSRRLLGQLTDRLRAAGAGLPRPADIVAQARQRLDLGAAGLRSGIVQLQQGKTLRLARSSSRVSIDALRQFVQRERRDVDRLGARLGPAARRSALSLRQRLTPLEGRLKPALKQFVVRERRVFDGLAPRLAPLTQHLMAMAAQRLAPMRRRLLPSFAALAERRLARLDGLAKLLDSLGYPAVLARGYAVVVDDKGQVIRAEMEVGPGDPLIIKLSGGEIGATVTGAPRRRVKKPAVTRPEQTSLF